MPYNLYKSLLPDGEFELIGTYNRPPQVLTDMELGGWHYVMTYFDGRGESDFSIPVYSPRLRTPDMPAITVQEGGFNIFIYAPELAEEMILEVSEDQLTWTEFYRGTNYMVFYPSFIGIRYFRTQALATNSVSDYSLINSYEQGDLVSPFLTARQISATEIAMEWTTAGDGANYSIVINGTTSGITTTGLSYILPIDNRSEISLMIRATLGSVFTISNTVSLTLDPAPVTPTGVVVRSQGKTIYINWNPSRSSLRRKVWPGKFTSLIAPKEIIKRWPR